MNKFHKLFSSVLAAAMLLSSSVVFAGAATPSNSKSCNSPKMYVVNGCQNSDNCNKFFEYFKSNGCDIQKLLEKYNCNTNNCITNNRNANSCDKNSCSQNNCVTNDCEDNDCDDNSCKDNSCKDNSCAPTQSVVQAPTQAPTQPAAKPVEKPTQPATKPAEQPVKPSEQATQPTTKPQTSSSYNEAYENEVIRLVNVERAKYGLSALSKRADATTAAEIRAKEIVQSFSHTRPNGTSCFTVCKEVGISYKSAGENIAYGYRTPQQVVNGWMNSEGHRKNILSASFTSIGVGCYQQGSNLYWSQLFLG